MYSEILVGDTLAALADDQLSCPHMIRLMLLQSDVVFIRWSSGPNSINKPLLPTRLYSVCFDGHGTSNNSNKFAVLNTTGFFIENEIGLIRCCYRSVIIIISYTLRDGYVAIRF